MKKNFLDKWKKLIPKETSETIKLTTKAAKIRLSAKNGINVISCNGDSTAYTTVEAGVPVFKEFPYYDEELDIYSDGKTMIYPLSRGEISETDLNISNEFKTYAGKTDFEIKAPIIPEMTLNNVYVDYAYIEDINGAKGRNTIEIERESINTDKNIEIRQIKGECRHNLLTEPLREGLATLPIDYKAREVKDTSLEEDTLVPITELYGDSYANAFEEKIPEITLKPIAKSVLKENDEWDFFYSDVYNLTYDELTHGKTISLNGVISSNENGHYLDRYDTITKNIPYRMEASKPVQISVHEYDRSKIHINGTQLEMTEIDTSTKDVYNNLYNTNACTEGYTINDETGEKEENSLFKVTDYIDVENNTTYSASPVKDTDINGIVGYALYDSTKTFISKGLISETNTSFTTTEDTKYIILIAYVEEKTAMVNKGRDLLSYKPYGEVSSSIGVYEFTLTDTKTAYVRFSIVGDIDDSFKFTLFHIENKYNREYGDKFYIKELYGNTTNIFREPIPVPDVNINLWTTGDPVLQTPNLKYAFADTSDKKFLGSADLIAVPEEAYDIDLYCALVDLSGNKVTSLFTFKFFDENLNYLYEGTLDTSNTHIFNITDRNIKYFLCNITNYDVVQQEGLYKVIFSNEIISAFPLNYVEPKFIATRNFPIHSLGEVYTDKNGNEILDENNDKQYRINFIVKNRNLLKLKETNSNSTTDKGYSSLVITRDDKVTITLTNAQHHSFDILNGRINPYIKNGDYSRYYGYSYLFNNIKLNKNITYRLSIKLDEVNLSSSCYITLRTPDAKETIFTREITNEDSGSTIYEEITVSEDTFFNYLTVDAYNTQTGSIKISEVMLVDTQYYNGEYIPAKEQINPIILPQPLRSTYHDTELVQDRAYYNEPSNKYIIEKNIGFMHISKESLTIKGKDSQYFFVTATDTSLITNILKDNEKVIGKSNIGPVLWSNTYNTWYIKSNIIKTPNNYTNEELISLITDGLDLFYCLGNMELVFTNHKEQIRLEFYPEGVYTYIAGNTSADGAIGVNKFNKKNATLGKYQKNDTTVTKDERFFMVKIPVKANDTVRVTYNSNLSSNPCHVFDNNGNRIGYLNTTEDGIVGVGIRNYQVIDNKYWMAEMPNNNKTSYIIINGYSSKINEYMITVNHSYPSSYITYDLSYSQASRNDYHQKECITSKLSCRSLPLTLKAHVRPDGYYTFVADTSSDIQLKFYENKDERRLFTFNSDDVQPANIFDGITWTPNLIFDNVSENLTHMQPIYSDTYSLSDYIPINNNVVYQTITSQNWWLRVVVYDSNKNPLRFLWNGWIGSGETLFQKNDYYIRMSVPASDIPKYNTGSYIFKFRPKQNRSCLALNTNYSALSGITFYNKNISIYGNGVIKNLMLIPESQNEYAAFYNRPNKFIENDMSQIGELQPDGNYKIDIISRGKNIFDEEYLRDIPNKKIINEIEYYVTEDNFGSDINNSKLYISGIFKRYTRYTIQRLFSSTLGDTDICNIIIMYHDGKSETFAKGLTSFTTAANKTIECIYVTSNVSIGIGKIQIEEGTFATEYEVPKKELTPINLPQPLRKSFTVYDRLYWNAESNKYIIEQNLMEIRFKDLPSDFPSKYMSSEGMYNNGPRRFYFKFYQAATGENYFNGLYPADGGLYCNNKLAGFTSNNSWFHDAGTEYNNFWIGTYANNMYARLSLDITDVYTAFKWLQDNDIRIFVRCPLKLIETDITERYEAKMYSGYTSLSTNLKNIQPIFHVKSDLLKVKVNVGRATTYYFFAETDGPVQVRIGAGSYVLFNSATDRYAAIYAPNSNTLEQTLEIIGNNVTVKNVMLRYDSRSDIEYFEGFNFTGEPVIIDDVQKYKIKYDIIGGKNILDGNNLYEGWKKYGISDTNLVITEFDGRQCIKLLCGGQVFNKDYYFNYINENTQYTLTFQGYYSNNNDSTINDGECLIIRTKDSDHVITSKTANQWNNYVFTNNENTTLESICGGNGAANYFFIDINTIQLEMGTEATEFTPYEGTTKEFILDEPLRSTYNTNCYDEITSEGKLIRRIKEYNVEDMFSSYINDQDGCYRYRLLSVHMPGYSVNDSLVCEKFAVSNGGAFSANSSFWCDVNSGNIEFYITKLELTDNSLDAAKAWVRSKGGIKLYVLVNTITTTQLVDPSEMIISTNVVECITNNYIASPYTKLSVPYKYIKPILAPANVSLASNNGINTVSWEGDLGTEEYDVKLGNEIIGIVKFPNMELSVQHELSGNITVVGKNFLTESEPSTPLAVFTLPNTSKITAFRNGFELDGRRIIDFDYSNTSKIATGYKFYYKIDGGEELTVDLGLAETPTYRFDIDEINESLEIMMVAYNRMGETNFVDFKKFTVAPPMEWSYLTGNYSLVLRWYDEQPNDVYYRILRYGENQTIIPDTMKGITGYNSNDFITPQDIEEILIPGDQEEVGGEIKYYLSQPRETNSNVSLVMIDNENYEHLISKPTKMGYSLDMTLLPPSNFQLRWVDQDAGIIEFSWIDNYEKENKFELKYSLNGGAEQTVNIISDSKLQTGKRYVYRYTFPEKGILTARLRMVWDLNSSDFTNTLTANFIEVTGLPPAYVIRRFENSNLLRISWEEQMGVAEFHVNITIDGEEDQTIIITDGSNYFDLDMTGRFNKQISVNIVTKFINDVVSEPSNTYSWSSGKTETLALMYNCSEQVSRYDIEQKVIQEMIKNMYPNYFRITYQYMKIFELFTKNITKDLVSMNPLEINMWGTALRNACLLNTNIYQSGVRKPYDLRTLCKRFVELYNELRMIVYYAQQSKFNLQMEVNKVRIVCFGDSITAGHPGFWAESMTGQIDHQYEYWLDRRLKGNYEIINKGYGSDRTYNLLDRIDKDVIALEPAYCIIQIGTNDIYWGAADANGDKDVFETTLSNMKNNLMALVDKCFKAGIKPIVGNLIPRTQTVTDPIVKYGLYSFNDWIAEYANTTEGLNYIDFFNAGKNNVPPTPLEDPNSPGALNPLYDGKMYCCL